MRRLIICLILLVPVLATAAAPAFDYTAFGRIAVQSDGRIKPLDSLARVMQQKVCGQSGCNGMSASQWLAFMFFSPRDAMDARMLSITEQAARMLGLPPRADGLYSFAELAKVLPLRAAYIGGLTVKDKSALAPEEAQVLRVYAAANDFIELMGTFSLLLPLNGIDTAGLPHGANATYLDLLKVRSKLAPRALARMALQEQLDGDNELVRVIPPVWGGEEWLSPWGVLKSSSGSPESAAALRDWQALAESYRRNDAQGFQADSARLLQTSLLSLSAFAGMRVLLEWYYHWLNLLPLAALCYGLGILLSFAPRKSDIFIGAGLILHGLALAMRMLILLRPPVSTLYESLIFVSFVVMAASAWPARRKSRQAMLAGLLTGLFLLLLSWVFAGSGDTLGVLVAVLNTNFWLATHVVCITTGYASALVAGALAHLYLFRRAIRVPEPALVSLAALLYRTALAALLFTATGTMLGGIWADQSWGRFWGWDPKENGALLIVLWLIWALHGRIAGQLGTTGFAAVMALTNIVVALAWIGVNLLGVGLHSYGFTDASAVGLPVFCALEVAFVAGMLILSRRPAALKRA